MNRWLVLGASLAASAVIAADGGAPPSFELRPGAVGVVRVIASDATADTLEVIFPGAEADGFSPEKHLYGKWTYDLKFPVANPKAVVLFDAKGDLATIQASGFQIIFWCENDGGVHFRPMAKVKVPKKTLRRGLKPVKDLQEIAAFVRVPGKSAAPRSDPPWEGAKVALKGKGDARIATAPDGARNCDGEPKNDLDIVLTSPRGTFPLRCCGP